MCVCCLCRNGLGGKVVPSNKDGAGRLLTFGKALSLKSCSYAGRDLSHCVRDGEVAWMWHPVFVFGASWCWLPTQFITLLRAFSMLTQSTHSPKLAVVLCCKGHDCNLQRKKSDVVNNSLTRQLWLVCQFWRSLAGQLQQKPMS